MSSFFPEPPEDEENSYLNSDQSGQIRKDYATSSQDNNLEKYNSSDIDLGKRIVASMIDVFVGYIVGLAINCIPFLSAFFQAHLVMIFYLIIRDGFFNGRGIGKNLMGLQVVDSKTGEPATFKQSFKRNIVLFGPALLLSCTGVITRLIPSDIINAAILSGVQAIGGAYTVLVIPYECWRVYSRADGLRLGDQLAGTATVISYMDFSRPAKR